MQIRNFLRKLRHGPRKAQLDFLLDRDGVAVVFIKDREYGTSFRFFVTGCEGTAAGFKILGNTDATLTRPMVGMSTMYSADFDITKVIPISDVPRRNNNTPEGFKAFIKKVRDELTYDERLIFLRDVAGEPIYLSANCNINDSGFSAKRAYPTEHNPKGECGVFIEWKMIPFYPGSFDLTAKPMKCENFIYYEWMGDRVRDKSHVKARDEIRRVNLALRLNKFKEKILGLTQELNELIVLSTERRD